MHPCWCCSSMFISWISMSSVEPTEYGFDHNPSLTVYFLCLFNPPPPHPATISYPPFFFLLFPSFCLSLSCLPPPPFPMSASLLLLCFLSPPSLLLFQSFQLPPPTLLSLSSSLSLSLPSLSFFSLLCPVLGALIPWWCIAAYWCYHVLQRQQDAVGAVFPHGQARHSVCGGHRTQRPDAQHAGPVQHREKCKVNRHISTCSKQHLPFPPSFLLLCFVLSFFGQS